MTGRITKPCAVVLLSLLGSSAGVFESRARPATTKQESLDEWRSMTAPTSKPPRVFVKGSQVRFYFPVDGGVEVFTAEWSRTRVPTSGYQVKSALLRWNQKLTEVPEGQRGWREAIVWGREL